ncbi:MAG: YqaJ viral recombinase family protein [Chloroflexota bacterium]
MDNLNMERYGQRQTGIGGSDVAAVLGVDTFRTPLDVWREKMGLDSDQEPHPSAEAGKRLEGVIARWWSDDSGLPIKRRRLVARHKNAQCLLGHTDRIIDVNPNGILEVKNRSERVWQQWPEFSASASEYYQIQHYLHIFASKFKGHYQWGEFAVLVGGNRLEKVPIELDPQYESIMQYLVEWWERQILGETPPEPVSEEKVKSLYPAVKGNELEAADYTAEVYEKARGTKQIIERLQERHESLETQLKLAMRDAEVLKREGTTLATWKKMKDSTVFDTASSKEEHQDLYQKYLVQKAGSRRFSYKS